MRSLQLRERQAGPPTRYSLFAISLFAPSCPPMRDRPEIVRTVSELRRLVADWRRGGASVALVTTMGALHAGHIALVHDARSRAARTVVSIFVNPTQFGPNEDFARYPRDEASDVGKLAEAGVDVVFAPAGPEIYPPGFATTVTVAGPADGLESDFRPHFFKGVATVVAKLLLSCLPDCAIFGEKDYQQLAVIKRVAADLTLPVEIVGYPTVRETDGLALSSRNAYLSPAERQAAPRLYRALTAIALQIYRGEAPGEAISASAQSLAEAGFRVDYLALRNAESLAPVADLRGEPLRLLVAAWLGKTRLIDNIAVKSPR
jgi:pantoate--beta-alanine ligase